MGIGHGQVVNSSLVGGEARDGEKRADGVRMYMSSYGSLVLNQILKSPNGVTASTEQPSLTPKEDSANLPRASGVADPTQKVLLKVKKVPNADDKSTPEQPPKAITPKSTQIKPKVEPSNSKLAPPNPEKPAGLPSPGKPTNKPCPKIEAKSPKAETKPLSAASGATHKPRGVPTIISNL